MIRDFARNVSRLSARTADGAPVTVTSVDKSRWQCAPVRGPLRVDYEVYAWDLSVRSAHLDQHHGYFNGTSLFLAVAGQEDRPVSVELCHPEGVSDAWRVATTLTPLAAPSWGFGTYTASSYDELIDHPVEMGCFDLVEFEACGTPHAVVVTGRHQGDLDRLARDLKRICEAQIRFFGGQAPFARYLFQLMVVGQGYGGLEHRSSTSLLCSRDDLPLAGESESQPGNGYRGLLGLCSHEYFHSWNIKRLKPALFMPYDLRREQHTPLLWFFEGFTSYYDDLFLVRTGLISVDSYLELLGQHITRHLRTPGRFEQTVSESSFHAWTRYYKMDENTPNRVVSYYVKGALVGLCLDLLLRQHGHTLDEYMQHCWQRFALQGRGVAEEDLLAALDEIVTAPALRDFMRQALHETTELPWQALMEQAGITVSLRAGEGAQDAGGRPGSRKTVLPWLGVKVQAGEGGAQISHVTPDGPAERAGLSAGDCVVALDGLRTNAANWEKRLQRLAVGDSVSVYAFRRDEWLATTCVLTEPPLDTCVLALADDPVQRVIAEKWLLDART